MIPHKTCTKCVQSKPLDQFYKKKQLRDGYTPSCKACIKIYSEKYRSEYRDVIHQREQKRNRNRGSDYYSNRHKKRYANPIQKSRIQIRARLGRQKRRAILVDAGTYTNVEWDQLCANYDHCCLCCGERRPLTADHIVPLSKGGANTIDNLQPLCQSCNSSKGNRRQTDYRPA